MRYNGLPKFDRGDWLMLEEGDYSDRHVVGVFKVLREFSSNEVSAKYLEEFPEMIEEWKHDYSHLVKWLIDNDYIGDEIDYRVASLGSYGSLSHGDFIPIEEHEYNKL